MARWEDVVASEPEFAGAVQAFFDAHRHKTLATLRADGAPRISGIEASFIEGEVWFGGMWRSRKLLDLQRDGRFALHSASEDPPRWKGDAKIMGRAEETADEAAKQALVGASGGEVPSGPWHLFRADISEVVMVRLGDPADHLVIELWREGRDLKRMQR
ncbi:MAG: pyridoxamine 5'-phosphate oxidase family protein [Thermoleophilaceae bacterium]|nr:pyridoxamine 5'-phosphate oxidase family protein [Thermoleophilaceae bacterium]